MIEPPVETAWSRRLLRRYAAIRPSPIPTTNESRRPVPTANRVHGRTERMIDITDVPLERNELPRLPCTRLPRYWKYGLWIGALRLMSKRRDADAAASACDICVCCMAAVILT